MKLEFQASFDVGDLGGLELSVVEAGGASFSVIVSSGEWFLYEDGATASGDFADLIADIAPLLTEIETQLNAGTGGATATYEVSWDATSKRVFFFVDGAPGFTGVTITPVTNGGLVGLTGALALAGSAGVFSAEAHRVPDYWIDSDVGFWGPDWTGEYEGGDDFAYDVEGHDGTPGGASKSDGEEDTSPTYLDFDVPLEPVEKVGNYPRLIEASAPWTWRDFWRHCRNVQAFTMRDDDEVYYLLMRAENTKFRPRRLGKGYIAHWDLDFKTRVLARGA